MSENRPIIRIKNWAKFQHYRNRKPPWIKLHRELLDDYEFQCLGDASKALAPMLWLLASEYADGEIPYNTPMICWRLHYSPEKLANSLEELRLKGFLDFASDVLAACKQDAIPEVEKEKEKEKKNLYVAPPQKPKFEPPAFNDVCSYMVHLGVPDPRTEAAAFIDHHAQRKWHVSGGRGPMMTDWRAAVRTWQHNLGKFGGRNGANRPNNAEKAAATIREAARVAADIERGADEMLPELRSGVR